MRLLSLLLLPVLCITLTACPFESDYPLGEPGDAFIDKDLPGTWIRTGPIDVQDTTLMNIKVSEAAYGSNSYKVITWDKPSDDKEIYTGYTTVIDGSKFAYVRKGEGVYYVYSYEVKGDKLSLWELYLPSSTQITSTKSFRAIVSAALKKNKNDLRSSKKTFQKS